MDYEEREKLKIKGWKLFYDAENAGQKANILLHFIITSHYWRAREELENRSDTAKCLKKIRGSKYYSGYTIDIDHYTEHWMHANQEHECMQNGVMEEMKHYYTPRESKYMPKGHSSYYFIRSV